MSALTLDAQEIITRAGKLRQRMLYVRIETHRYGKTKKSSYDYKEFLSNLNTTLKRISEERKELIMASEHVRGLAYLLGYNEGSKRPKRPDDEHFENLEPWGMTNGSYKKLIIPYLESTCIVLDNPIIFKPAAGGFPIRNELKKVYRQKRIEELFGEHELDWGIDYNKGRFKQAVQELRNQELLYVP